ncbi:hypothetical protein O1611_g3174 [Lasiodiplodia mahajangana]|uniref:Uncharacterized protein n=1 Tax=Lasiodiplodia mahajangana TaxID=1108764 RepID=A0ACC2JSS4_9PEZI|nr:hypothetical protein O1611_g3174 [Lasiodiplodia mahajangana]
MSNHPYLLPTMDRGPMILLPPKHAKEVYGQPETRLDVWDTINDSIQTKYTIQDHHIIDKALHRDVLRNQISRNLGLLTDLLAVELDRGLKRCWGTDTSKWRSVPAFDSCLNIVARAANAAFLGPSLCRDEVFLKRLKDHATSVFSGGILINVTPGPFKHIGLWYDAPPVKERLEKTADWSNGLEPEWTPPVGQNRLDPISGHAMKRFIGVLPIQVSNNWLMTIEQHDGLQWMIEESITKCDPAELDPQRLCERLLFLNDVSMHTSAFTLQTLLQNLAASDPRNGYIEILRNECKTVLDEAGGEWTREAVQKLVLLDSTIRESMRMSPFSIFGLPRTVIDPNGISVRHDGSDYFLPRGSIVTLPVEHAHYDEQVYLNARSFQPFRFATVEANTPGAQKGPEVVRAKTAVTLDDHFLAFGHGKHGCPGRFFVIHEIKLMMANILLNYEIEPLKSRKELIHVMWLKLPLNGLRLRVRRRPSTEDYCFGAGLPPSLLNS